MIFPTSYVLCFVTWYVFLVQVFGKIGFPKDHNMDDHRFPPLIDSAGPGIPDGHLRPLGFQKRSSGKVTETLNMPTPHMFYIKYVKSNTPVLIHEALKDLEIFNTWDKDAYLKENYGSLNMTVTVKKQLVNHVEQTMTMKKFLLDYMYEEWYLASTVPDELRNEIPLPGCFKCGTLSKRLQESELWMSSGGASSLLHSHEEHNLHCVLFGRKDFIIIENKYKTNFDFKEKYFHSKAGKSPLNMDMINMFKYPEIKKTPWNHAILRQGDCLFVPSGYLHQVRSYGRGISCTVLFSPSNEFDSSDCSKKSPSDEKRQLSLADADFVWTFINGTRVLQQDKMEPSRLQNILLLSIGSGRDLYREQFEHFYENAMSKFPEHLPASEAFQFLTKGLGKDSLTSDDIARLKSNTLLKLSSVFNDGGLQYSKKKDEL